MWSFLNTETLVKFASYVKITLCKNDAYGSMLPSPISVFACCVQKFWAEFYPFPHINIIKRGNGVGYKILKDKQNETKQRNKPKQQQTRHFRHQVIISWVNCAVTLSEGSLFPEQH